MADAYELLIRFVICYLSMQATRLIWFSILFWYRGKQR
jgi:hypothetical protein